MQIISSLLNLQSSFIKDPEAIDVFRESQNRVKSMALLHENLYQSRDMDRVDFRQYVKKLTDNLLTTYSTSSSYVQREIMVEDVKLNIETAIPCGLIINELLTNSLKYAFPNGEKGTIYLKIYSKEDKYVLLLGDNGVGLPDNFDPESTQTLGLRLVHNLVNQIDGQLSIRPGKGTCFEIVFHELQYKKRI
jgi:Signal transduction histidine kinase